MLLLGSGSWWGNNQIRPLAWDTTSGVQDHWLASRTFNRGEDVIDAVQSRGVWGCLYCTSSMAGVRPIVRLPDTVKTKDYSQPWNLIP